MSIQLKPSAARVDAKTIRLPTTLSEEDEEDFEDVGEDDESTSWSAVDGEEEGDTDGSGSSSYFETETDTDDLDDET